VKKKTAYKRIILKLSGEVLRDASQGFCLDRNILQTMATQIRDVLRMGIQTGVVIGGGNIFRGAPGEGVGINRTTGDAMGMLATIINSLALRAALESAGVPAEVMSAIPMGAMTEPYNQRRAVRWLEQGKAVIFAGGTGNPYFTTDSAAALRAAEVEAEAVFKATKVDGIYSDDPVKNPNARRFERLTFEEALAKNLKIMDAAAFSLCRDNGIAIVVFNFFKKGELRRVVTGARAGTLVSNGN
jgi:uridylate kinase